MKRFALRLGIGLWLSTLTGWAQPPTERAQEFYAKALARKAIGDFRGILQQAGDDPACSLYLLKLFQEDLPGFDAPTQFTTRRLMTLLARGLALRGQPRPFEELQAKNLLTPEEAGMTLESAPSVTLDPGIEEGIEWNTWGALNIERLADLGNFRQCARLTEAYRGFLKDSGQAESPLLTLAQQETSLLAGDFPYSAARRQQMVECARGKPDELRRLYALLAATALDNGRPDVAREMLEPLEQSLLGAGPEQRGLAEFVLETTRFQLEMRASSQPDWGRLLRGHQAAWSALASYHGHRGLDTRIWQRGVAFWLALLNGAANSNDRGAEAVELIKADNVLVHRLSSEALAEFSYCAQLEDLSRLLLAEMENQRAQTQPPEHAAKLLELTRLTLEQYRQWLTEDQQTQNGICPPAIRRRLGGGFQLDLLHGDLSRTQSRYLALGQLVGQPGVRLDQLILESQLALKNQGQSGFGDARYLMLQQPGLSVAEAEVLLKSLAEDWERIQFRPGRIALAFEKGRLLEKGGKHGEAIESLERATALLDKYLADYAGGVAVVSTYRSDYELLARLHSQSGHNLEAFAVISRLNNLDAQQRGGAALLQRPELAQLRQLGEQSQALEDQAARQRSLDSDSAPQSELLAQTRQQFHQELDKLLQRSPQYRQALTVPPPDLARAQRSLPADTILVQYLPGPEGLYVFLVSRKELKLRRVAVPQSQLDKAVGRLRARIASFPLRDDLVQGFSWTNPNSPGYRNYTLPLLADSKSLYGWLIRPLEAELRGYKVLAFIPSGNLYYLPLAGLVRQMGPKGPDFVANHWQCVELVKAADLQSLSRRSGAAHGGLLGLANPDGSLAGAEREVRQIARFFPKAQLHFGKDAESKWLRPLPAGIAYLHLATHGVLNAASPVESYLVAAGQPLRIRDVYTLHLKQVRLVTLSACQTAVQEGERSGQDVTSLAQAFSVAGGQAVLASLWDVSDEGTEHLMTALYPHVARGQSLSWSLQQAQLQLMAQPHFQHPYYWAAFSLFGDWR